MIKTRRIYDKHRRELEVPPPKYFEIPLGLEEASEITIPVASIL